MPADQLSQILPSPTTDNATDANQSAGTDTLSIPHLVLEDFVVTALLRLGRPLRNSELAAAAEGFTLSRAILREGLAGSSRVASRGRDWDLTIRIESAARPRDQRARRPLEGSLDELLRFAGKPLPLAVIIREVSQLRSVAPETIRDAIEHVLMTSRSAVAAGSKSFIHAAYTLDAGAPREEIIVRSNQLTDDPSFAALSARDFGTLGDTVAARASTILGAARIPLSRKLLGYLLWKNDPSGFDARELSIALGDRTRFYSFVGGFITTQEQLPSWRALLQEMVARLGHAAAQAIDIETLLKQRVAPEAVIAPRPAEIEEIRKAALASGQPISLVATLVDSLEMEPDDPMFVPTLQGFNDALRRADEFMPAGLGQFLLRESVPAAVGTVPASLRPVHLTIRNPITNDSLDVEMSDEGLEGDAVDFIHAPMWEDIGEEAEVKLGKRPGSEPLDEFKYVVLYHHYKAGTLKLRRQDEEFFALQGSLTRINMRADDGETIENAVAWASRDSGLIYGLDAWYATRIPASGGVLKFSRPSGGGIEIKTGVPDKLTCIDNDRLGKLEPLQDRSAYLSIYDLLQTVLAAHPTGAELPTLWAEVNTVRRTSKRLVCSVLAAYNCFFFKQRGPKQILWRFDEGKTDQGFKRNKRKFVRR